MIRLEQLLSQKIDQMTYRFNKWKTRVQTECYALSPHEVCGRLKTGVHFDPIPIERWEKQYALHVTLMTILLHVTVNKYHVH